MPIQLLPVEVISKIKSSATITSLNGVIIELFKNSLDAGSTKVEVNVDYSQGGCIVEDNGTGIAPEDFGVDGGVGKLHHTSKLGSQTPVHGRHGSFLASLSAMALVSITSHHHDHRSHNTLSLHQSHIVSRQLPAPPQQHLTSFNHGTRIIVSNLFGNMPVRVRHRASIFEKQRGTIKEWEELRHEIVKHLLPWTCNVSITIREIRTNYKIVIPCASSFAVTGLEAISRTCSILSRALDVDHGDRSAWIPIKASTEEITVWGASSIEPYSTKSVQFISIGILPVAQVNGQGILHDEINRLFMNSAFGIAEDTDRPHQFEGDRSTHAAKHSSARFRTRELKSVRKGVDRWPKFVINIDLGHCRQSHHDVLTSAERMVMGKSNELSVIIELLRTMFSEFLTKYHFRPTHAHRMGSNARESGQKTISALATSSTPATVTRPLADRGHSRSSSMLRISQRRLDSLDTNIKLPSFRRSQSQPQRPFGAWSRVKSGNPVRPSCEQDTKDYEAFGAPQSELSITTKRLDSCGHETESQINTLDTAGRPPIKRTMAGNGKIVSRPFDDVEHRDATPNLSIPVHVPQPRTHEDIHHNDQSLVYWINPITKVKSAVDMRTGLVAPSSRRLHNTSPPTNETLKQRLIRSASNSGNGDSLWISKLLKTWDNPVFQSAEQRIPLLYSTDTGVSRNDILQVRSHHCSREEMDKGSVESVGALMNKVSKDALKNAKVISHVDKKFILVKVPVSEVGDAAKQVYVGGNTLIIIDQHAADERIRVEKLLEELCSMDTSGHDGKTYANTQLLSKVLTLNIPIKDLQLLAAYQQHFANWGIIYDTPALPSQPDSTAQATPKHGLIVRSLPPGIVERCRTDSRLLTDLLRTEVWKVHERGLVPLPKSGTWLERIQDCPQGLLDMLNSRACRSAIMFNDDLAEEQCRALVSRLAECKFPFKCAHGRPSLVPLVNLKGFKDEADKMEGIPFGRAFKDWRDR